MATTTNSWIERLFPSVAKEKELKRSIDGELSRLQLTVSKMRLEHGLTDLMTEIEAIRAEGEKAMR